MIETSVTKSGPLFDGRFPGMVRSAITHIQDELADRTVEAIQARLDVVLKNPTGYYRSRITKERRNDEAVVTDGDVIYGPWLEGVSSRNQTTRFKGYQTFERVTKDIQEQVGHIVEAVITRELIE